MEDALAVGTAFISWVANGIGEVMTEQPPGSLKKHVFVLF